MLQNIQDYTLLAPDGLSILSEPVKRRFPKDDKWIPWDDPKAYSYTSSVAEVIQEILQRHASGISFREYNAGPNLDMQMTDKGFQIDIHVDWKTGLIHGGNQFNCGTWMDKMGESVCLLINILCLSNKISGEGGNQGPTGNSSGWRSCRDHRIVEKYPSMARPALWQRLIPFQRGRSKW
jgi:hypothetical protein